MSLRLGFFASHGGSNMQAILDRIREGRLDAEAAVAVSNNSKSRALERAREAGVPTRHFSSKTHPDPTALDQAILDTMREFKVDLIVMAGYMKKLGPKVVEAFHNRILNIHPALLPKHGGPGMFGMHVHESVIRSGDKVTGVTIHLADELYDHGRILSQREVSVKPDDTPETLQQRVLAMEHKLYADTIQQIANGEIQLD